jgi:hypothetical protein
MFKSRLGKIVGLGSGGYLRRALTKLLLMSLPLSACIEHNPDYFLFSHVPRTDSQITESQECPITDVLTYCDATYELRALVGDCHTPEWDQHCKWSEEDSVIVMPITNNQVLEDFKKNKLKCTFNGNPREFRYGYTKDYPQGIEITTPTYTVLENDKPIAICSKYLQMDLLD